MKARYHSDPEYRARCLKKAAEYRLRNPNQYREYQRADRARDPEKWRNYDRKAKGLPEPDYPAPEHCEICGSRPTGKFKTLCLEHDHITGMFRGWVCSNCNLMIGNSLDSVETLEKAAQYLKAYHARHRA
jgi:Recombination endonuclease VII